MGWFSRKWKQIKGWFEPSEPTPQGINIEKSGTNQAVPIIYGFQKKAPCIKVFKVTTDKVGGAINEYLHYICVFSVGEIEEIGPLYFNEIPESEIDNERYFVRRFNGSETQTHCSELSAEFYQWKSTAKLKNVAYAYVRLKQNDKVDWWSGDPSIAADIKGLKVLDPRDGLVKYSENAALCTLDYLTNENYGKGLPAHKINSQSFVDAANFIETIRTYNKTIYLTSFDGELRRWEKVRIGIESETITENLMSCNVNLDAENTLKKNVEILLGGMRAILPETNGQYRLGIEKDDAATFAFTKDNLIGGIQCQGGSQSDRYNQVIIKFRNKLTGEEDEAVFPEDDALHQTWKSEDSGKLLLGEFDFKTINNKAEALQMGHVIAHRSRELIGALFTGIPETIAVEAGDVVTLDSKIMGWAGKPFRIESVDIDLENGAVSFQAVEHQNHIYPWAVNDVVEEFADTSFALPSSIAPPTNLAFIAISNDNLKQGKLSWDNSNNALIRFYVVETFNSASELINTQQSIDNFVDIFGLPSGDFTFKVSAANSLYQSLPVTLSLSLTQTSIGWHTVVGFDYDDSRISNDAITGFVTDSLYASEKAVLQAQIDKSITTWFLTGLPTLTNNPGVTWTTTDDKNTHLGDLYYDNATGYAYRFMVNTAVYSWHKVSDSDVTKALADAAKAQDTADTKRRVFVAQPVVPYDVGDLWDTGSTIERAQIAKAIGGSYAAGDWKVVSDTTNYNDSRVSNDVAMDEMYKATRRWKKQYRVNNTVWLELLYFNGSSLPKSVANALGVRSEYSVTLITVSTGTNNKTVGNLTWNGSVWVWTLVSRRGSTSNHPNIVISGGKPKVRTYHGSIYPVEVLIEDRSFTAISEEVKVAEAKAISTADAASTAKANLAETRSNAFADDIVTREEARAIADATTKANNAKSAAISAADQLARLKSSDHVLYDMNAVAPSIMPYGSGNSVGYSITSAKHVYSDYIPVRRGETLHWEIWAKQTGSSARAYVGIERFDRYKQPISGNTGCVYGGLVNTLLTTYWKKYVGRNTLPTSHTPYSGSDGKEVCFVKLRLLMNYRTSGRAYYSGYRLFRIPDQKYLPNLIAGGAGSALNKNPLSSSDNGSTAKITVASHTRQYGFGVLSLNAGSITGLAFNTKYYVYYDDASYLGGGVSYKASTNIQSIAAGNHRIYVSVVTTPRNGDGTTRPPPDLCVCLDMWLTPTLKAELVTPGDELDLWWQGDNSVKGKVLQAKTITNKQVVYELETSSGAIVRISESTPIELENHVIITPKSLMINQDKLATLKGSVQTLCWETVTRCEIIGERPVMHISVGDGSFAAGIDPRNRIITHNGSVKP